MLKYLEEFRVLLKYAETPSWLFFYTALMNKMATPLQIETVNILLFIYQELLFKIIVIRLFVREIVAKNQGNPTNEMHSR